MPPRFGIERRPHRGLQANDRTLPYLKKLRSAHTGLAPGNGDNHGHSLFSVTLEIDTRIDLLAP